MRRLFLTLTLLLAPACVHAHEFMVVPTEGEAEGISVILTESWIRPDRMPPADKVVLERIDAAGRTPLALVPAGNRLAATLPDTATGPAILSASMIRDRMEKPRGKPAEGEPPPAERMTRSAAYAKHFANLSETDDLWSRPVGSRLEVVPLANPVALKPGAVLPVQILFDGQPVAATVQATWDDGGREGHGFVVRTRSGADGKADIPIDRAGLWLVRAKHGLDETREGYVRFAGSANITFHVP